MWITGAVSAIKVLSYVYDLITFPVYIIFQRPWEKRKASRRIKAKPVSRDEHSITYRNIDPIREIHVEMERQQIDTLDGMLKWVSKLFGEKRCLGTRQILAEEDEIQPNGRVFKKVLESFFWKRRKKCSSWAELTALTCLRFAIDILNKKI